jgi:hypothetical protein
MARKIKFRKMFRTHGRRQNPPPATAALAVGALMVGLTVGGIALYSREAQAKPKKKADNCAPYKFNTSAVRASIDQAIDRGDRDPLEIAVDVATEHFGNHPDGGAVTFPPPAEGARKGVTCVWNKVIDLVSVTFDDRGIEPGGDGDDGAEFIIHDPTDEGYPWEQPSLERNNYPTPGMFADVGGSKEAFNYDQGPLAVSAAALSSAIAMAADRGYDVSTAQSILSNPNTSAARDLKAQMISVLYCSRYNDALYGRELPASEKTSADNLYGWVANKRSPRYGPVHNDALRALGMGVPPKRAIGVDGKIKSGGGSDRRSPVFWVPAINLSRLAGPNPIVTTNGMSWSDGSSTSEPPPVIQRIGVNMNGVVLPGGPGCK